MIKQENKELKKIETRDTSEATQIEQLNKEIEQTQVEFLLTLQEEINNRIHYQRQLQHMYRRLQKNQVF